MLNEHKHRMELMIFTFHLVDGVVRDVLVAVLLLLGAPLLVLLVRRDNNNALRSNRGRCEVCNIDLR